MRRIHLSDLMLIAIPLESVSYRIPQGRDFNQFAAVARDLLKSTP
jgi:hypothetical protein